MELSVCAIKTNGVAADIQTRAINACLQGLSPTSRRVYSARLSQYLSWSQGVSLSRESVRAWLHAMELSGASAQVRNQSLAAIKRFAAEAAELEWIPHMDAVQIARVRSKRIIGAGTGLWLDAAQLRRLLAAPDRATQHGRRDACVLALLAGCGLRRAEACALRRDQARGMPDGRLMLVNVAGKGGRTRSVAVPRWAQHDIERWLEETETAQ